MTTTTTLPSQLHPLLAAAIIGAGIVTVGVAKPVAVLLVVGALIYLCASAVPSNINLLKELDAKYPRIHREDPIIYAIGPSDHN